MECKKYSPEIRNPENIFLIPSGSVYISVYIYIYIHTYICNIYIIYMYILYICILVQHKLKNDKISFRSVFRTLSNI